MGIQGSCTDWKNDHLASIKHWQQQGVKQFLWSTAKDEFVCSSCKEREGKFYSESELIKILNAEFCIPDDEDDRCRCVILPQP